MSLVLIFFLYLMQWHSYIFKSDLSDQILSVSHTLYFPLSSQVLSLKKRSHLSVQVSSLILMSRSTRLVCTYSYTPTHTHTCHMKRNSVHYLTICSTCPLYDQSSNKMNYQTWLSTIKLLCLVGKSLSCDSSERSMGLESKST